MGLPSPASLAEIAALGTAAAGAVDAALAVTGLDAVLTLDGTAAALRSAFDDMALWIADGYRRRPVIMIGLAGLALVPLLAVAGLVLQRRAADDPGPVTVPHMDDAAPRPAWIKVGGTPVEMPTDREVLMIGRQDDNDICIEDNTVHRYHALIERTRDAGFFIVDMSGPDGNGVRVNGERRAKSCLNHGDIVELGRARLEFATAA